MEKKVVYRLFTIADYEREDLYFREMHAKGWKLRKVSYSILLFAVKYTFEKCHPEQVSYQLDFYPMKKSERAFYLQLFKDCDWEHITDFNGFSYLRKLHSGIESDAEFEIYNDAAGKLAMVKRILTMRMLPILLLFLALLPVFSKFVTGGSSFSWGVFLIFIIDWVLLIVFTIQISYIFWRLSQKWKELSNK
ncbi:membrane protein [Streptococcus pneumoniae]|uniref:Membrane protein n=1 Tax=Streptococcus pneumoniae TaxID=1313 RepID=A0AA86XFQ9_STREE|nr:membrane protein [Streptococcus pneumoniae]CIS43108.1 membrane protein [Streptococcus pneumoniae]CIY89058.1 membrane protein [Streptococcus pneumoniae]CJV30120.1 membrane protein [Streptococcus pneumoniae]CJW68362.1 membrane protein [Streptococcus pneumoniae]